VTSDCRVFFTEDRGLLHWGHGIQNDAPHYEKEATMIECRQYPRIPVDLQVYFSTTGNKSIREGTMFDLSAGGCAVASMTSVQPGSAVRILIRATDLGSPITIESAAVRWSEHGEFGVEFLGISEIDQSRLRRLLQAAETYQRNPS
jgi:c-di-GMP-binding flagellar brake protein YcgR